MMSKEYGLGLLKSKKEHGTSCCYVMPKKALLLASITMYCAPSIDWPHYQDRTLVYNLRASFKERSVIIIQSILYYVLYDGLYVL